MDVSEKTPFPKDPFFRTRVQRTRSTLAIHSAIPRISVATFADPRGVFCLCKMFFNARSSKIPDKTRSKHGKNASMIPKLLYPLTPRYYLRKKIKSNDFCKCYEFRGQFLEEVLLSPRFKRRKLVSGYENKSQEILVVIISCQRVQC